MAETQRLKLNLSAAAKETLAAKARQDGVTVSDLIVALLSDSAIPDDDGETTHSDYVYVGLDWLQEVCSENAALRAQNARLRAVAVMAEDFVDEPDDRDVFIALADRLDQLQPGDLAPPEAG